jgi:uncharacterized membrane protein YfcA
MWKLIRQMCVSAIVFIALGIFFIGHGPTSLVAWIFAAVLLLGALTVYLKGSKVGE